MTVLVDVMIRVRVLSLDKQINTAPGVALLGVDQGFEGGMGDCCSCLNREDIPNDLNGAPSPPCLRELGSNRNKQFPVQLLPVLCLGSSI